jgi:hypothetical protein
MVHFFFQYPYELEQCVHVTSTSDEKFRSKMNWTHDMIIVLVPTP